jgi:hypothetical protein
MTQAEVLAWLVGRRPVRPAALAARMDRAVCEGDTGALGAMPSMAEALALLGVEMLRRVNQRTSHDVLEPEAKDAAAIDLLAADAFVTYAFEAAAEGRTDVGALVARLLEQAA